MDKFEFQLEGHELEIYRWVYPYIDSNMYAILSDGDAVVFDPHKETELLELLYDRQIEHTHILLTHEHYDHVSGVNWLCEATCADVYCQKDAAEALSKEHIKTPRFISTIIANEDRKDGGHRYRDFKAQFEPYSIKVDKLFTDKDSFRIGCLNFEVNSTPGHSPGSSCYYMNNCIVFTGDTLHQYKQVILGFRESSKDKYEIIALPYLRSLPINSIIMPGHGDPFLLSETDII